MHPMHPICCRSEDFQACFPGNAASELTHKRSWSDRRLLSLDQQAALRQRLTHQAAHTLNWEACWAIAQELKVPYEMVSSCWQKFDVIWLHLDMDSIGSAEGPA